MNRTFQKNKGIFDTVVFLTPRSVNAYEERKWSFEYIRSQGFAVIVINLDGIYDKKFTASKAVVEPLIGEYINNVSNYCQLEELIRSLSGHSIFIDYLVSHSNLSPKFERVFRMLKKYDGKYVIISSGLLPTLSFSNLKSTKKLLRLLEVIYKPKLVLDFFKTKIILLLTKYRLIYPVPLLIFGGHSERLDKFILDRDMEKSKVVLINSFDYDESFRITRSLNFEKSQAAGTCVFLDEAATHHSDFILHGIDAADENIYFNSMNSFFTLIEKKTGLKVLIAAHPRAQYQLMGDVFLGREVIFDRTAEIVAECQLVIMHSSTSVSYAVMFNKPVIAVRIPGVAPGYVVNDMVECVADAIGCSVVSVSNFELDDSIWQQKINASKYQEYKDKYIRTKGANNTPEWEVIINTIKQQS